MASSSPAVVFHPVLALSPVRQSFSFIDWTNTRSSTATSFVVVGISRPQALQLQHAQEQPLEYIASEYDHAFSYVRTLLQVLDHVTGPSPPGRILTERLNLIVAPWGEESTTSPNSSIDDASSSALEYLRDDPRGVMTHSILTQLYDFIGVVLTMKQPTQSTPTTSTSTSISTLFYQPSSSQRMSSSSSSSSLMLELREDWRPLLRILYRTGDAFCQQYAATILMTILMGGGGGRTTNTTTTEDTLKSLISWIISQLQSSHSHTNLQVVLPAIWVLSTCGGPHARRFFFGEGGGIGYLSQHLRRFITTASTTTTTTKKATPKTPPKSPKGTPSSSSPSVQQVYEVLFCLWTMILDIPLATTTTPNDDDILLHSLVRDGTIRMMMQLLSMAPREKIVRMTLRILAQLVRIITSTTTITSSNHHHSRGSAILSEMLVASRHHHSSSTSTTTTTPILETLKSLQLKQEQQQWDDVDMKEDLKVLTQYIQVAMEEQTNWEVYQAELEAGCLQKGVVHTEAFWKTHVRNMEGPQGDFAPVRRLIQLIAHYSASQEEYHHHHHYHPSTYPYNGNGADNVNNDTDLTMLQSEQDECVSMALYDLGEFVRWYPNGKSIATRLGAKAVVLPLLSNNTNDNDSDNAHEVQRQALVCISKLLVNNWKAIS